MNSMLIVNRHICLYQICKGHAQLFLHDFHISCSGLDVDECANNEANNCHVNAFCTNYDGSYNCECKQGYTGDGLRCTGEDNF